VVRERLLLVDDLRTLESYAPSLRPNFDVSAVSTVREALLEIERKRPAFVITELRLPDGNGVDICRAGMASMHRPTMLVTTDATEMVPAAITAGCDGVLLKPFAPNLLYARLGRLRRDAQTVRARSALQLAKSAHLRERSDGLVTGTNRVWPNSHCPSCDHNGVVSFDYASHRRMWYACLACEKVWIARRQEEMA
jgi:DNA-binding response OmpR family regulator